MAVYERTYRGYQGDLTPGWSRFLVIPRYAYRDVFKSRIFTGFFTGCFVLPFSCAVAIYLQHNLGALVDLGVDPSKLFPITARSFDWFLRFQALILGFLLVLIVGPGLVSADLRNNALPLYLGRPFTRTEYVAGKMSVLAILLSAISWVPGLLLFALAAYFEGWSWFVQNIGIAIAVLASSWLWIIFISLLSLALSAWVKWRPLASGALIGVFLVSGAFGTMVNVMLDTRWGNLLHVRMLIQTVWAGLFQRPIEDAIPVWAAVTMLAMIVFACLLLLRHRVQAYEVVR